MRPGKNRIRRKIRSPKCPKRICFAIITFGLKWSGACLLPRGASGKLKMNLEGVFQWARIALCAWVVQAFSAILFAQMPAACKGPAELEKVIATHPSTGVYDALGAY